MTHSISSCSSSHSSHGSVHSEYGSSVSSFHSSPDHPEGLPAFSDQRLHDDLSRLLDHGNNRFKEAAKGNSMFLSRQLKKVVDEVELNQNSMSRAGLLQLRKDLSYWSQTNPNEYDRRYDIARELKDETEARLNDPLLGMARTAQTNAQLVDLLKSTHDDQVYALFCHVVPDLTSHKPVKPETIDMLSRALVQPFIKNFQFAATLVERDPNTRLDNTQLSLVTEPLARLPRELLQVMKENGLKFVATHDHNNHRSQRQNRHLDLSGGQGLISYAADEKSGIRELRVTLKTNDAGQWELPANHGMDTVNLLLNSLGRLIDTGIGRSMLNLQFAVSSKGFQEAWWQDRQQSSSRMGEAFRGSMHNDHDHEVARQQAFGEGFARTFFVGRNKAENDFGHWQHIGEYFKAELIPKLDRINRGIHVY